MANNPFILPRDFLQGGLEINYDGRPYIVRNSDYRGVQVCAVFQRRADDERGPDVSMIEHGDPKVTVSWSLWTVRARAAYFLHKERYFTPALHYLDGANMWPDGTPRVLPAPSAKILEDAMRRCATGESPALGALTGWSDYGQFPEYAESNRSIYVSCLNRNDHSYIATVAGPENYRGLGGGYGNDHKDWYWSARYYTAARKKDAQPHEIEPHKSFKGMECDVAGKAEADKALATDWVLL